MDGGRAASNIGSVMEVPKEGEGGTREEQPVGSQGQQASAGVAEMADAPDLVPDNLFLDGIHYSVESGDNNTYLMQDFSGIFSTEDLYAAMDPSTNSTGEMDEAWHANNLMPFASSADLCRMHEPGGAPGTSGSAPGSTAAGTEESGGGGGGTTVVGYSNGSFYRMISRATESAPPQQQQQQIRSMPPVDPCGNSRDSYGSQDMPPSPQQEGIQAPSPAAAAPAKVRKPRGRKPKHVKEAEAAAAAAAAAKTMPAASATSAKSSSSSEGGGSSPPPTPPLTGYSLSKEHPASTLTIHHRAAIPLAAPQRPMTPQSSQPVPAATLGHLARHDRQFILAQRISRNALPPNATLLQRTPTGGVYSTQATNSSAVSQVTPHAHHHTTTPSTPAAGGSGRLDQLFSSRIAAPSNRNLLKPNIIQENRAIYKLLTAPTVPRPGTGDMPDNRKERWTQMPNPIILDENEGRRPSNNEEAAALVRSGVKTPKNTPETVQYSPFGSIRQYVSGSTSTDVQRVESSRVNIRREPLPPVRSIGSATEASASYQPHQHVSTESYRTLFKSLEAAQDENYRMRCINRYLRHRLRHYLELLRGTYEQIEGLKINLLQNEQLQSRPNTGNSPEAPSTSGFMDESFVTGTGISATGSEDAFLGRSMDEILDSLAGGVNTEAQREAIRQELNRTSSAKFASANAKRQCTGNGVLASGVEMAMPSGRSEEREDGKEDGSSRSSDGTSTATEGSSTHRVDLSIVKMEVEGCQPNHGVEQGGSATDFPNPLMVYDNETTTSSPFNSPVDGNGSGRVTSSTPSFSSVTSFAAAHGDTFCSRTTANECTQEQSVTEGDHGNEVAASGGGEVRRAPGEESSAQ